MGNGWRVNLGGRGMIGNKFFFGGNGEAVDETGTGTGFSDGQETDSDHLRGLHFMTRKF